MKKVSLLLILVFAAFAASAQEAETVKSGISANAGRKTAFAPTGFWENWFIGAGAAGNVYFGDFDADARFFARPTVAPTIQIGKWFSPVLGARLKAEGGRMHTFNNDAHHMTKNNYVNGHADIMWNVSNYFGKYNPDRFYSFIPYAGIGFAYGWDYKNFDEAGLPDSKSRSATINAGLINSFRISKRLALEIELSGTLLKDDFDKREDNKYSYDAIGGASANLVYKIGKTGFSEAVLFDQRAIDDLNGQINDLHAQNARLSAQLPCPKCPEPQVIEKEVIKTRPAAVTSGAPDVVFFRLNSSVIDKHQEINVFNAAKYLKENSGAKVKVIGYADKGTGTSTINSKLSEKRAKAVADALINKYGISSSRVSVDWKGSGEQPYNQNDWNRVALIVSE